MKIIESNCATGVVTERDMTPQEIAIAEAQYAAWLAAQPPEETPEQENQIV